MTHDEIRPAPDGDLIEAEAIMSEAERLAEAEAVIRCAVERTAAAGREIVPAEVRTAPAPPEAKPWWEGLSTRERRFVEEWLISFNGTSAAKLAGFSAKTAYASASRMLKRVKVANAIERALNEVSVSRVALIAEVASLAFTALSDLLEWTEDGTVKIKASADLPESVRRGVTKLKLGEDGRIQEIEAGLRGASLAHLLRALRIDKPESLISVNSGGGPLQVVLSETDQLVL